ncbi:hypothetical protein OHA18_06845 [Kribbella sp. NBC_00709]|uniref:hypothetical protein n=1 Tax=Kribbella sp. NBC_00709 TaxID=2975972 RepID=UPI002E2E58BF|nr:hypothetical protein [Kribbella sp. NBC_00709]
MTDDAVEISPDTWEYRLVAAVVYAVEQRAGGVAADARTRWNGRLLESEDPDFLGFAEVDGSVSVSVANVLEPLRRVRDLDRALTDDEAWEVRDAFATLTHEAAHLLAENGDEQAPDAYPYDAAAEAFNEGRTEHWTHLNLDNVVRDVFPDAGLEHAQVAVMSQSNDDAYAAYTPAARHLDQALATRSGLTDAQVTQKLMCADDLQRWNVAVDLVIDERFVKPGLMPEAHRAEVRKELVAPLRDSLAGLVAVEADESVGDDEKAAESMKAARSAVAELDHELNRIERKYRIDKAERAQQQASRPASRRNQAVRQAEQDLPPNLRRLRALTDPQAPAAGATKRGTDVADHAPSSRGDGARARGQQASRPQSAGPNQPPSPQRG